MVTCSTHPSALRGVPIASLVETIGDVVGVAVCHGSIFLGGSPAGARVRGAAVEPLVTGVGAKAPIGD
jgi:hypothetical protein